MICNNNSNEIYVQRKVTPVATVTPSDTQNICTPNTVFFQANTGTGLLYQWKKSGAVIAGATNSNYTATTNGKYKVVVTGSTGCTKVSSQVVVYITACREEQNNLSKNEIKIYPNPSTDVFSIGLAQSVALMRVMDMQGKMLYQLHDMKGQIQLGSELPAGIYLLELTDAKGERTIKKLVKTD